MSMYHFYGFKILIKKEKKLTGGYKGQRKGEYD